jgi:hypothetical protein
LSSVSFSKSSIILGSKLASKGELSSKHGFVLTSINQHYKSESIMKSKPNNSKQLGRILGLSFAFAASIVIATFIFIFSIISA